MSFWPMFKVTFLTMIEIFLLGACGFILIKRKFINESGLEVLTKLVINLLLPAFIFSQFMQRFSFSLYKDWLIFPLLSIVIMFLGWAIGLAALKLFKVPQKKSEQRGFLSLVMFQNSGYLPLILAATLFTSVDAQAIFIYIFLFLLGFNLSIWSFGCWFLRGQAINKFEWPSLFNPPVIAVLASLLFILIRLDKIIPVSIINAADMLGKCVLPLAMIIVGGGLALIPIIKNVNKKAVLFVLLLKLIALPSIALFIILKIHLSVYMGFLIMLETAVPSATSLSLIARHYKLEDELINQGIFYTHIFSLITIPVFLSLYQALAFK